VSRYCLDTSAYSHFKRGDPRVVDAVNRAEWIGVPTIVIGELWSGFLQGRNPERNQAELEEFLGNPFVEVVPVDDAVARIYAEIVSNLRRAATPLPSNDIWIAATAARAGGTVLTYDEHFTSITRVGSVVFPPPTPPVSPPGRNE
jgi:tRNA(fMet)-specific endonuclease VapC